MSDKCHPSSVTHSCRGSLKLTCIARTASSQTKCYRMVALSKVGIIRHYFFEEEKLYAMNSECYVCYALWIFYSLLRGKSMRPSEYQVSTGWSHFSYLESFNESHQSKVFFDKPCTISHAKVTLWRCSNSGWNIGGLRWGTLMSVCRNTSPWMNSIYQTFFSIINFSSALQ